jgi:hypothetical protein
MPQGIQPLRVHATHQQKSAKREISRTPTTPDPEFPADRTPRAPAAGSRATQRREAPKKVRATLPIGGAPFRPEGARSRTCFTPAQKGRGPVRAAFSPDP